MRRTMSCILLAIVALSPLTGNAVLFYSTGDISYNTTAPTGTLTNSGWQFQGKFGNYLGTPVGPHHFISAQHLYGWAVFVGDTFIFDGVSYTTTSATFDAGSDLMILEVDGTFPRYAPLYSTSDETGKDLIVFGRGVDRGVAVTNTITTDPPGPPPPVVEVITNGWKWGAYSYTQRWGENHVVGYADYAVGGDQKLLRADFDSGAGTNECMLTDKDSGGAVFIQDGAVWKLAGINLGVSPGWTFSFTGDASGEFDGSILDYSGDMPLYVWVESSSSWVLLSESQVSSFVSTRISSRYDWITNNVTDFDQDVDGLPDWWETLYEGNATSMVASADTDLDGFTHYEEWLADTIPDDSNSFLRVTDYSTATNLAFNSSTNRKYQIRYRLNLADTNENWQTEVDWFTGSNSQTVKSVSSASSNRFYHVRAKIR